MLVTEAGILTDVSEVQSWNAYTDTSEIQSLNVNASKPVKEIADMSTLTEVRRLLSFMA